MFADRLTFVFSGNDLPKCYDALYVPCSPFHIFFRNKKGRVHGSLNFSPSHTWWSKVVDAFFFSSWFYVEKSLFSVCVVLCCIWAEYACYEL